MNQPPLAEARLFAAPFLIAVAMTIFAPAANAHHSPAKYDSSKPIQIVGAVTKYEWANPHVYIFLEQTTDAGKTIEWEIECSSPSIMRRMGWSLETLHVGDILSVSGAPARDANDRSLIAGSIKRASNSLFDFASLAKKFQNSTDSPKFVANGLEGTWLALPTMQMIVQSAFPDASNLTGRGAQTMKNFDEKAMSPAVNCIPQTPPLSMLMPELKQIANGKEALFIRGESDEGQRTVYLNALTHEGAIPSHQGHSIGRWEGKTLVIDTTNFAYHALGNGYGVPSSPRKHLVERLTLGADGTSLTYHFELSDPEFLLAPRIGEFQWAFRPKEKFLPDKCDMENARRFIKN